MLYRTILRKGCIEITQLQDAGLSVPVLVKDETHLIFFEWKGIVDVENVSEKCERIIQGE